MIVGPSRLTTRRAARRIRIRQVGRAFLTAAGAALLFLPAAPIAAAGTGAVSGQVFLDQDGDGARGADEAGLARVTVQVSGGGDSRLTQTDGAGAYRLDQVPAGAVQVRVLPPDGYTSSGPAGVPLAVRSGVTEPAPAFGVRPAYGQNILNNPSFETAEDFAASGATWSGLNADVSRVAGGRSGDWAARVAKNCNQLPAAGPSAAVNPDLGRASVVGHVYLDANADGQHEPDEPGMPGVTVRLAGGDVDKHRPLVAVTDVEGRYRFDGLREGQYSVWMRVPTGFQVGGPVETTVDAHHAQENEVTDFLVRGAADDASCALYALAYQQGAAHNPRQGETYVLTAWVKADGAPGKQVEALLREAGGASPVEISGSLDVTLTSEWQPIRVTRTVKQSDRTMLQVMVRQTRAADGDSFLVDDVSLALAPSAQPLAAPDTISATAAGPEAMTVNWAPVPGASGARIVRLVSGDVIQVGWVGAGVTTFTEHGLSPNSIYNYRVLVGNDLGDGPPSASAIGKTAAPAGANQVFNPGFETDTTGWGPPAAGCRTLERVQGGQASDWAARVALGADAAPDKCPVIALDDSPDSVSAPQQGQTYLASAWVKAAAAPGKPVQLIVREQGGAAPTAVNGTGPTTLTGDWQQLQVKYTVKDAGRTSLELLVRQNDAAPGDAFLVDTISLVQQP